MQKSFSELVIEGQFVLVKGFIMGFLHGSDQEFDYFFHRKHGIRRETFKEFIKELFEFESDFEETSLPSGHTSTAFTVATVLSQRIDNTYASIALYSMASLTALQRVYVDRHWFSDTILGAALGTVVGLKVVKLHEENSSPQNGFQYSIFPQVNSGNYGIGLALQF